MNRIIIYICIVLLLPLLAVLSQAHQDKGEDCLCCVTHIPQQVDCGTAEYNIAPAFYLDSDEQKHGGSCPLGGLCQGRSSADAVMAFIVPLTKNIVAKYSSLESEKESLQVDRLTSLKTTPLRGSPVLFLLHCSFLI